MNINSIIENFLEYERKLERADKTLKLYKIETTLFIKRYNINTIEEIKVLQDIDFLVNTWLVDMKKDFAPSTINKKKKYLSTFSNYLVSQGILEVNKIKTISNIKVDNHRIETYTKTEIENILEFLDNRWIQESNLFYKNINLMYKAIFNVLYNLALRNEEVTKIKINDIDIQTGVLFIRCKGGKGEITHKSKLNKEALTIVKQWLSIRNTIQSESDLLFISPKTKEGITTEAIRLKMREMKKELGIDGDKLIHTLRHTRASELIAKGVEVKKVSMYLHHASQSTTEKYYIHNTDEVLNELSEL